MQADKIEAVMSEFLGEGYRIVGDDGALSPAIEWVDWVCGPDDGDGDGDEVEKVEVLSKMALPVPSIRACPCAKSGMNTRTSL